MTYNVFGGTLNLAQSNPYVCYRLKNISRYRVFNPPPPHPQARALQGLHGWHSIQKNAECAIYRAETDSVPGSQVEVSSLWAECRHTRLGSPHAFRCGHTGHSTIRSSESYLHCPRPALSDRLASTPGLTHCHLQNTPQSARTSAKMPFKSWHNVMCARKMMGSRHSLPRYNKQLMKKGKFYRPPSLSQGRQTSLPGYQTAISANFKNTSCTNGALSHINYDAS